MRIKAKVKLLRVKGPRFKPEKAYQVVNDSGGHYPLLQNTGVYCTARQEGHDEDCGVNKYLGNPISSVMLMMDDMPEIRSLSPVPLYAWYWNDNQLKLWEEVSELSAFISIDASG